MKVNVQANLLDFLYLGEWWNIEILKVKTLTVIKKVKTKDRVNDIVRWKDYLIVGEYDGYLEILEIKSNQVLRTYEF